jgi:hypothetical protein
MPLHDFECKWDGETVTLVWPIGGAPKHPPCPRCRRAMAKRYSIPAFSKVEIDVMSPATGYFSSTRKYEDSLKRLSYDTVERTGFDTNIVRAEPNDAQSRPVES